MYPLTCHCNLQDDKITDAVDHTLNWISQVKNQYEEPKYYEAFQDIENPNKITFFMTFSNQQEEQKLGKIDEAREFGEKLYEMCTDDAKWVEHNLVNSIRDSKPDSDIHTRIEYKVRQDKIEEVKNQIITYIDTVREMEPDIRVYESYQNKKDTSQFIHLVEFKDKKAEQTHKNAAHTKNFVEYLYPLCEQEPKFRYMKLIGSVRR